MFRKQKGALTWVGQRAGEYEIKTCTWADGVARIRRAVFERDGHQCVACPQVLTWKTMHCHERQERGSGGAVSLENCESRCYHCHLEVAHGDRQVGGSRKNKIWRPRGKTVDVVNLRA